ncbi:MAG: Gfo/Idh/MocA family oxidoreductase [Candidatus Omnitrophota bacterium]
MNPIKMVITGTAEGHMGGYLSGIGRGKAPEFECIAVSDFDPARLKWAKELLAGKPRFFSDWREMLDACPEAEAVIIGSDKKYHFEMFREAIRRKLHIYSMKVVTMNEAECAELLALTRNYGRTIQVELELHFGPQFQYAKKLVESGRLGKIESIYLTNISISPIDSIPNLGDPELHYGSTVPIRPGANIFRGGAVTDHPHPYDLIRWITGGEFKKVFAVSAKNQRDHLKVEDHAAITGELHNGIKVFINPSYSNLEEKSLVYRQIWPKSLECNLKITGTKGYYATDYFDKHIYLTANNFEYPDKMMVGGTGRVSLHPEDSSLLGSFAQCVRGLRAKPESTLADGIAAVKVMNAAYESIYHNKEIYL